MPSLKESYVKNRSQLGDPVSLKSETSTLNPTPDEKGSTTSSGHAAKDVRNPQDSYASSSAPVMAPAPTEKDTRSSGSKPDGERETLREKAAKKLQGDQANPSLLGDPVSLKAEQSDLVPTEEEKGAKTVRRNAKL